MKTPTTTMTHTKAPKLDHLLSIAADGTLLLNGWRLELRFVDVGGGEHTLRATLQGEWIEFSGSLTGSHRVTADGSITSTQRVYAHWTGYVSNSMISADKAVDFEAADTLVMARAA
jgi:hypothetical protein